MNIQSIVENDLIEDDSSVWILKDHSEFGYSEGTQSEEYLEQVFRGVKDLSTLSTELEGHIKDWSSEYHLTRKRAQLLSGFEFDRTLKVLEVGCGCGAITRHLGENFDEVVSVEGSLNRARLARLRTRDLDSISIICAPFQEVNFTQKFNIIFCVGVYEYSGVFIAGDDPYEAALQYFSDMLTPDGVIVIAIENQFGFKYLNGSREDHLGVTFDGVEGYRRRFGQVRTFGKVELEKKLRGHFPEVTFFYPYPDYKIPDCVLSEEFLASGHAAELVSQMRSRDYAGAVNELMNESATVFELARNNMLDFFSNSFLVLASRGKLQSGLFNQLAVIFSSSRKSEFSTWTKVTADTSGALVVSKRRRQGGGVVKKERLSLVETEAPWIHANSLQTQVQLRALSHTSSLQEIFEPCRPWVELLRTDSTLQRGIYYLEGEHIDSIWPNVYPVGDKYNIVDKEWVWDDKIRMNSVVIRAIYDFLSKLESTPPYAKVLSMRSGRWLIRDIAKAIGVDLVVQDFEDFIRLESDLQWVVFGVDKVRQATYLRWYLLDRPTLRAFHMTKQRVGVLLSRIRAKLSLFA